MEGLTPEAVAEREPGHSDVWTRIVGTGDGTHYGRPFAFHRQAQAQDWAAAWAKVRAPVLAVYGEYDWFESVKAHRLVADIVNRNQPGRGRLVVIPGTDHHFMRYPNPVVAVREVGGTVNADVATDEILRWLAEVLN